MEQLKSNLEFSPQYRGITAFNSTEGNEWASRKVQTTYGTSLDKLIGLRRELEAGVDRLVQMALLLDEDPKLPNYRFNRLCGGINQYMTELVVAERIRSDFKVEVNDHLNPALAGVTIRFTATDGRGTYASIALPAALQFKKVEPQSTASTLNTWNGTAWVSGNPPSGAESLQRKLNAAQHRMIALEMELSAYKRMIEDAGLKVEYVKGSARGRLVPDVTIEPDPSCAKDPFGPMVEYLASANDLSDAYDRAMRLVR